MTKYKYKFVGLEFKEVLQEAILAVTTGIDQFDVATWSAILETVQKTANEYGEDGWKLYGWYLQPTPHIVFERAVTTRKRSNKE